MSASVDETIPSVNRDAFGYVEAPLTAVLGAQVGEGKVADTLQPIVAMVLRLEDPPTERLGFALHPDLADELANQLHLWAKRAREKHYE